MSYHREDQIADGNLIHPETCAANHETPRRAFDSCRCVNRNRRPVRLNKELAATRNVLIRGAISMPRLDAKFHRD
jgi:hypothetical protein